MELSEREHTSPSTACISQIASGTSDILMGTLLVGAGVGLMAISGGTASPVAVGVIFAGIAKKTTGVVGIAAAGTKHYDTAIDISETFGISNITSVSNLMSIAVEESTSRLADEKVVTEVESATISSVFDISIRLVEVATSATGALTRPTAIAEKIDKSKDILDLVELAVDSIVDSATTEKSPEIANQDNARPVHVGHSKNSRKDHGEMLRPEIYFVSDEEEKIHGGYLLVD